MERDFMKIEYTVPLDRNGIYNLSSVALNGSGFISNAEIGNRYPASGCPRIDFPSADNKRRLRLDAGKTIRSRDRVAGKLNLFPRLNSSQIKPVYYLNCP